MRHRSLPDLKEMLKSSIDTSHSRANFAETHVWPHSLRNCCYVLVVTHYQLLFNIISSLLTLYSPFSPQQTTSCLLLLIKAGRIHSILQVFIHGLQHACMQHYLKFNFTLTFQAILLASVSPLCTIPTNLPPLLAGLTWQWLK